LLLPLVKELIANDSDHTGWILTGPAIALRHWRPPTCCVRSCLICTCGNETRALTKNSP
jgi:hypothetical protein